MSSCGLLRPTPMLSMVIYLIFLFYYLKSIRVMFSKCICIIKRNIDSLWLHPDPAMLEKVYRIAQDVFKISYYPQTDFMRLVYIMLIRLYIVLQHVFYSLVTQPGRFLFTPSFTKHVVLLTLSFPLFRLGVFLCFMLWWLILSSTSFLGGLYCSSIHWIEVVMIPCFISIYCFHVYSVLYNYSNAPT